MSHRVKRTVTTVTSSSSKSGTSSSTPLRGTAHSGASSPRSERSQSPTMISRMQEKNDLAHLNDRLAAYIERVRQLEAEKSRLTRIIESQESSTSHEVTGIKAMYEDELANARRLIDDLGKEKAKLQIEVGKLKSELEELREKLKNSEKDLGITNRKLLAAESQVNDLQARLNDALNQRRHFEDEYNKLKKDYDALLKSNALLKKQAEDETLARVDLQNRLQSLKEELAFKNQVHQQELSESMSRSRVVIEETDERLKGDYDSRLAEALREMREENELQLRIMREESDTVLERKLAEMRELAERGRGPSEKTEAELRRTRIEIDSLNSELSKLRSQNAGYEARIRDLENELRRERDVHDATVSSLNAEIRRLRDSLEAQLQEYRDLMDVKIQLDAEIAAYRKMLESEESRLNITQHDEESGSRRTGTGESSRKRKRVEEMPGSASRHPVPAGEGRLVKDTSFSSDFSSKATAKDVIEIYETSTDGQYVKLFNSSPDKDVQIGGWQIVHQVNGEEMSFKFPSKSVLKAQQYVTVWSSSSTTTHSPPTDYVMRGLDWYAGDHMKTLLVDKEGEELASREVMKTQMHRSFTTSGGSSYSSVETGYQSSGSKQHETSKGSKWGWSLFSSILA